MTQPSCDGNERHTHYVISTSTIMSHVHEHTKRTEEFNRLHHHSPLEHDNFTNEELEATADRFTLEW